MQTKIAELLLKLSNLTTLYYTNNYWKCRRIWKQCNVKVSIWA